MAHYDAFCETIIFRNIVQVAYEERCEPVLKVMLYAEDNKYSTVKILINIDGLNAIKLVNKLHPAFDWYEYIMHEMNIIGINHTWCRHVLTLLNISSIYTRLFKHFLEEAETNCNQPLFYTWSIYKIIFWKRTHVIFELADIKDCYEMLESCKHIRIVYRGCHRLLKKRFADDRKIVNVLNQTSLPKTAIALILGHTEF